MFDSADSDTLGLTAVRSCALSACHVIASFIPCHLSAWVDKSGLKLSHSSIRPQEVPVHILQGSQECTKVTYHIASFTCPL